MGRRKHFSRAGVLEQAIPLFWERGYAGTSLQELVLATGVNKSGLYTEFDDKEALFIACLEHYLEQRGRSSGLAGHPLGWDNIERFLLEASAGDGQRRGCFSVNAMRELNTLPAAAAEVITRFQQGLLAQLAENLAGVHDDPAAIADMVLAFFLGLCTERQLHADDLAVRAKVANFLQLLRAL